MREAVPPAIANIVLAAGVTLAVAVAIGFTLAHRQAPAPVPVAAAASPHHHIVRFVNVRLTEPVSEPVTQPAAEPAAAETQAVAGLRRAESFEPFDPPPPPMAAVEPVPDPVAVETASPQGAPAAQTASIEPAAAPTTGAGTPLPGLRTVALDTRDIHGAPERNWLAPPMAALDRDARHEPARPLGAAPAPSAETVGGVGLVGQAIVTAGLELNVAGRPLRLYGAKLPAAGDLCAPEAGYAARSCPDVARQVLAEQIAAGQVKCRVLAVGGRSALPAVCADQNGDDLGTWLVAHGFALADANDIVDYSTAESKARAGRDGLWHYR